MTYQYKGRGMVQLTGRQTGKQSMNTTPIPSLSISSTMNTSASTMNTTTGVLGSWPTSSVTISGTGYSASPSQGLFEDLFSKSESHYKKYEVYEFQEDVLAISCAWKRHRDNNPGEFRFSKLTDRVLFDSVNSDDRNLAKEVRDYYSKKIMMLNLKGTQLTSFRKALNSFVHGSDTKVIEELFPLIYRLPEFYEYDICLDDIKLSMEDRVRGVKLEKFHGKTCDFELTPVQSIKKANKRIKVTQYWFNGKGNTPVLIELEPKNPLLHIWDSIFNSKKVLQISGMSFIKDMDDFEYLSMKNWKLDKI